jgi:hypothetical protein
MHLIKAVGKKQTPLCRDATFNRANICTRAPSDRWLLVLFAIALILWLAVRTLLVCWRRDRFSLNWSPPL